MMCFYTSFLSLGSNSDWKMSYYTLTINKDGQWGRGGKKFATEKSEYATKISWWQIMV